MSRFFTCHWKFNQWRSNEEGSPISAAGHTSFGGVEDHQGHKVYIVSISERHLFLGGRMTVDRIVSREEAVRITGNDGLWDAPVWVIGDPKNGTPLNTHRRLSPELSQKLLFLKARSAPVGLFFIDHARTKLDAQTTRVVRELTPESAALLDEILGVTDRRPFGGDILTITDELLIAARQGGH